MQATRQRVWWTNLWDTLYIYKFYTAVVCFWLPWIKSDLKVFILFSVYFNVNDLALFLLDCRSWSHWTTLRIKVDQTVHSTCTGGEMVEGGQRKFIRLKSLLVCQINCLLERERRSGVIIGNIDSSSYLSKSV